MVHGTSGRIVLSLGAAVLAMGAIGCASKPRATAAPVTAAAGSAQPAAPAESVVEAPVSPVPSVEVSSELPEDIQELNRRGYLADAFFDTDRYDLRPDAREALARNAAWLQRYPGVRIVIEGHCDERNTREYNLALGQRRADAARDYLASLGIAADRMSVISYGEEHPFASGSGESVWQLNRRAHFVITSR